MIDITTVVGLVLGCIVLGLGMLADNPPSLYYNLPSIMITFGGAIAATCIQFPMDELLSFPKLMARVFFTRPQSATKLIKDMTHYAEIARRDGILALEGVTEEIEDKFLVRGLQLAVDGTDPELIQQMLSTELDNIAARHSRGKKLVDALAFYCPAFGMVGTLIGLVAMLKQLDDPAAIGPGMAVALLTTFYGALACYFILTPFAKKLERRSEEEQTLKEMIIRGVMSIQSGDNPRVVEQKLSIFLAPRLRAAKTK